MKSQVASLLIILSITIATPAVAFAQANTAATPGAKVDRMQEKQEQRQSNQISNLKLRANREIDRRIAALNKLTTRITNIKKLSSGDKSTLTSQIQTQITDLTSLKSKVDADTDLATLRSDVKSIVDSYRIFALFIPKIHLLAAADSMSQAADNLTTLAAKLQDRIQKAQAAGNDVTNLNAALSDLQAKVADAKTQYQNAENLVLPLTPDGYPANKAQLDQGRAMVKTGAQDLKTARADAVTIINGLKSMKKTPVSSPSPKSTTQ